MPCPQASRDPRPEVLCPCVETYRPDVSTSRANFTAVSGVLAALDAGDQPEPALLRDAVRALLALLRQRAPGRSVEVRVPPYGAIQCVEGPVHTRGKPPNVVQADPVAFVRLATGRLGWVEAIGDGRVTASGIRADLTPYLPIWDPTVNQ